MTSTTTYNYDHANRLIDVDGVAYVYDNNGNLTRDDLNHTLIWDAWNRLVQVKDSEENVLLTNSYDALGRRVTAATEDETRDLYY